jgi:tetratricopeptide (TPR) repeat protein
MSESLEELVDRADHARADERLADAHRDLSEAVAMCRQPGVAGLDLALALRKLAQIERDLGHGDRAQPLQAEAVALLRNAGQPLRLAHAIRHLGDIHQDAGRIDQAEPCYDEALAVYRADPQTEPLDLANAIRPLAILKERTGDHAFAIALWQEAAALYAAVGVPQGAAESRVRLARLGAVAPQQAADG